jgi:hypothetical protein
MERAQLELLKIYELRALASQTAGVEFTPSDTKESLITKLLVADSMVKPETPVTEVKPVSHESCTIEDVKSGCNAFILRGLKLYHNQNDNTWLMQIKLKPTLVRDTNTGLTRYVDRYREDSGTLNQPLVTIVRCARVLMSNAPTPKEVEVEHDRSKQYEAVS